MSGGCTRADSTYPCAENYSEINGRIMKHSNALQDSGSKNTDFVRHDVCRWLKSWSAMDVWNSVFLSWTQKVVFLRHDVVFVKGCVHSEY